MKQKCFVKTIILAFRKNKNYTVFQIFHSTLLSNCGRVMKTTGEGSGQTCTVQHGDASQGRWYSRTELSVSSGSNYSLSDVIIRQPRPVDPSLHVSLHPSPAFSCHLLLSHILNMSLVSGRGSVAAECEWQGSAIPHYFCRMSFVMSGKCGGPGLFISGAKQDLVSIFPSAR